VPELPDIVAYLEALAPRIVGQPLEAVHVNSPFLVRTFDPPLSELAGKPVRSLHRIGKRIAIGLEGDLHVVLHLMIAGRLHWLARGKRVPRTVLASFEFPTGP
jgi:formamidopyrimidine-DNA glycosylase